MHDCLAESQSQTTTTTNASTIAEGISSNPGAVDSRTGTGELAETVENLFVLPSHTGVFLGGIWIGDANNVLSGGAEPGEWSFNSLLIVGASLDAQKLAGWPGGRFGAEFLQFDGGSSNQDAGSVQGYNSLPGPKPLHRSELYQLWWRQELFDRKLILRIGKVVPTNDFNNVLRPVPVQDQHLAIPAVSGLLYTPVFLNPTLLGTMPGYYNSAYGITTTFTPVRNFYVSYGVYDGNIAHGVQTGLRGAPDFNGYYFHIAEAGAAWELGGLPGSFGLGGWRQTGRLSGPNNITENGASGFYLFGSQRFWRARPTIDNSGISGFVQFGVNNSETLPIDKYFGAGLTEFGLVPNRTRDSAGIGLAWSSLNGNLFQRDSEFMIQAYYQAHISHGVFFEPAISYIPDPGANPKFDAAWGLTLRTICLF
ncbi:MAG: carbohydrate porin [Verrucomicrobia bacterium]|nr:carbohydrate porin [Verrucomicrobiota bacterium]